MGLACWEESSSLGRKGKAYMITQCAKANTLDSTTVATDDNFFLKCIKFSALRKFKEVILSVFPSMPFASLFSYIQHWLLELAFVLIEIMFKVSFFVFFQE